MPLVDVGAGEVGVDFPGRGDPAAELELEGELRSAARGRVSLSH